MDVYLVPTYPKKTIYYFNSVEKLYFNLVSLSAYVRNTTFIGLEYNGRQRLPTARFWNACTLQEGVK